jgi:hypothetical protein
MAIKDLNVEALKSELRVGMNRTDKVSSNTQNEPHNQNVCEISPKEAALAKAYHNPKCDDGIDVPLSYAREQLEKRKEKLSSVEKTLLEVFPNAQAQGEFINSVGQTCLTGSSDIPKSAKDWITDYKLAEQKHSAKKHPVSPSSPDDDRYMDSEVMDETATYFATPKTALPINYMNGVLTYTGNLKTKGNVWIGNDITRCAANEGKVWTEVSYDECVNIIHRVLLQNKPHKSPVSQKNDEGEHILPQAKETAHNQNVGEIKANNAKQDVQARLDDSIVDLLRMKCEAELKQYEHISPNIPLRWDEDKGKIMFCTSDKRNIIRDDDGSYHCTLSTGDIMPINKQMLLDALFGMHTQNGVSVIGTKMLTDKMSNIMSQVCQRNDIPDVVF